MKCTAQGEAEASAGRPAEAKKSDEDTYVQGSKLIVIMASLCTTMFLVALVRLLCFPLNAPIDPRDEETGY